MAIQHEIDLNGVVAPLCLLQMKNALSRLPPGELLKVQVHDVDLIAYIAKIVARSADEIVEQHRHGDGVSLTIRKG